MNNKEYKTKSDMIYHKVRDSIFKGEYSPGERLLIASVAEQYGISEIPVREAFRTLTQEGVLTSKPNNGFYISQISLKEVMDIFAVRINLEGKAIRDAVMHFSPDDLIAIEDLWKESKLYEDTEDYLGYWKHNRKWHFRIYEACENKIQVRLIAELYDFSSRYPTYFTSKEEIIESLDEHEKILKALRRKDAYLSEELIKLHTITTRDHYIVRLQDVFGERLGE